MTDQHPPDIVVEGPNGHPDEPLQGLPGGQPMPAPQPEAMDGVYVVVKYEGNGVKIENIAVTGTTRPTEVSDILGLAIKVHQKNNGIT